ncbi:MAG: hypothetical protein KJ977_01435, partial [Candidatus Omnitrophica bacterium]|nr:hypothetical protein [Candidatus Omnitrophota bacterium]
NKTLNDLLDSYFTDNYLKTILSVLILGLAGSPASQISALVACLIYREFVLLDGGYYPVGGMQKFTDTFARIFTKFSGEVLMSNKVKKIIIEDNQARGVILANDKHIYSKYVISACDARQTFFEMIGSENIKKDFSKAIESLIPSYSAFMVYLGMDSDFNHTYDLKSNMWIINSRDMNEIHSKMLNCKNIHFAITSPSMKERIAQSTNKNSICLTTNVPFINAEYWKKESNRKELENRLVDAATETIPELSKHIHLKFNATPLTLYKWTYNYQGAAYGWEGRINQFCNPDISEKTIIENLYLTGHWNNMGSGITSVANSGHSTAKLVLSKEKKL